MSLPLVGVLAGMGPDSTAPFLDAVIAECRASYGARHDIDFPPILAYSLPTPFYPDRPLDHAAMEAAIRDGLATLAGAGARFVAMPCNTAHLYYDSLATAVDVPLLHIVRETVACLPAETRRAALLATRPTVESRLYQEPLEDAGVEVIERPEWQDRLDRLLVAVKAGAPQGEQRAAWVELLDAIAAAGADALIVGCTDLGRLVAQETAGLPAVDSSDCLARAVVREYLAIRQESAAQTPRPRAERARDGPR